MKFLIYEFTRGRSTTLEIWCCTILLIFNPNHPTLRLPQNTYQEKVSLTCWRQRVVVPCQNSSRMRAWRTLHLRNPTHCREAGDQEYQRLQSHCRGEGGWTLCVCACVHARACVCVCVCVRALVIHSTNFLTTKKNAMTAHTCIKAVPVDTV